jgi:archaeal preflagellin peptidase FlaK
MYIPFDFAALSVALAGCYIGMRCDQGYGKIPNRLTGTLLLMSVGLAVMRINSGDSSFIWLYLSNFIIGFLICIIFWYIRAWSGGDAKMFWAIVSLLPAYPPALKGLSIFPIPGYAEYFFGLTILFNLLILLLMKVFLAAVYMFAKQGRTRELLRTASSPFMYLLASTLIGLGISRVTGIAAASYLSIILVFILSVAEESSYRHFLALWAFLTTAGVILADVSSISAFLSLLYAQRSLLIFAFLLSAYAVGSRVPFTRKVAIEDLRPGLSIGEEIYLEGGALRREEVSTSVWNAFISWALKKKKHDYLVRPRPAGLSEQDLGMLRLNADALGGFVEINTSFILMPFIMAALILSFFGDILWMILV